MPGMQKIPNLTEMVQLLQTQSELVTELPSTIIELQRTVMGLSETVAAMRETIAAAHLVAEHAESILAELDEPLRALRPGMARLAVALDQPVVDRIPATLLKLEEAIGPITARIARVRERSAKIARTGRRLTHRHTEYNAPQAPAVQDPDQADELDDGDASDLPDIKNNVAYPDETRYTDGAEPADDETGGDKDER